MRVFRVVWLPVCVFAGVSSCAEEPGAAEDQRAGVAGPEREAVVESAPEGARVVETSPLFVEHCSMCHGMGGRGDGAVVEYLDHKPRDLTGEAWVYVRPGFDEREELVRVITGGIPERGMNAFGGVLSAEQIGALADEVVRIRGAGGG